MTFDKKKLIIDTDMGSDIDDTLCLAYLLRQPFCEIMGITTCSSEPEKRAELVDSMCRYIDKEIPIFPGLNMPIIGKQLQVKVHQYETVKKFEHKERFPENSAIDFMKKTIEENPHEITIVAIGPLTNIGALFAAYPHLIPLIKEVSIMAGSYFSEAISFIAEEWNIKNDAIAAKIVFDSGVPIIAAGLDVSLKLRVNCDDFIAESHSKVMEAVSVYAEKFLERTNDMYFHDPLVAAYLFDKEICKFKRGNVNIGIGADWGRTYFTENSNANTLVAYEVDRNRFFEHYYSVVNSDK